MHQEKYRKVNDCKFSVTASAIKKHLDSARKLMEVLITHLGEEAYRG